MKNTTLVIGASENTQRYSFLAINRLLSFGHQVKAIGKKVGEVSGVKIEMGQPLFTDIDTVTLYINPSNQKMYEDYLISLKPRRVIFNPGTENFILEEKLKKNGIETQEACTLVLLSTGQF